MHFVPVEFSEPGQAAPDLGETALDLHKQRQRLLVFHAISVPMFFLFGIMALFVYTPVFAGVHVLAFLLALGSWLLLRKGASLQFCTHLYLSSIAFLTAAAPLYEDLMRSQTLWFVPALPLAAAFVLGRRAVYPYMGVAASILVLVALLELFSSPLGKEPYKPFDWVVLRLIALVAVSAFAGLTAKDASARLVELAKKRNEMNFALDEAQTANRSKSVFLANMSHEIRNPMNGILGTAEYLKNAGLDQEDAEAIDTIARCGEHLLGIIDDILDLSKIESGEITIESRSLDLAELLEHSVSLFRPKAAQAGVELHLHLPEHVPVLMGDRKRLSQVLSNLVGNAIKFSDHGSVHVEAKISDPEPGQCRHPVEISVHDQGIGMKPEQLERLFGEFEQVDDSEGNDRGGSGLGLAISRRLVEKMGGSISVTSSYGEGSSFCVQLSLAECTEASVDCAALMGLSQFSTATQTQAPRVLVVDDQPINLKLASLLLQKLGCEVEQAHDGREAIDKCASMNFDLIFMDMRMPVLSGLEAAMLLTENPGPNQQTPIVALTACAFDEDRQACLDAGMVDHLSKPLRQVQLEQTLRTYLCLDHLPPQRQVS